MAKIRSFVEGVGNVLYNNAVQIPFSVVKGLSWLHCLPSHINYLSKMEKCGFAEKVDPEVANPFWEVDKEKMNSQPEKKELFEDHFYGKISRSGEKLLRGKSELELGLSIVPQHFVSLISGISAGVGYGYAVSEYGPKALIPIAITAGLSLIHELGFNKKIGNLEDHLYEQPKSSKSTTQ